MCHTLAKLSCFLFSSFLLPGLVHIGLSSLFYRPIFFPLLLSPVQSSPVLKLSQGRYVAKAVAFVWAYFLRTNFLLSSPSPHCWLSLFHLFFLLFSSTRFILPLSLIFSHASYMPKSLFFFISSSPFLLPRPKHHSSPLLLHLCHNRKSLSLIHI